MFPVCMCTIRIFEQYCFRISSGSCSIFFCISPSRGYDLR